MSYLKDREIWLSNVPTGNPPAGYFWKFIQNGKVVVRDSSGNNQIMVATSGSQAITGSLTVTGGITGTATTASYVEYSNVANRPALVSGSAQIAAFGYATTGSNGFNGSQSITGSLTVTGQVVAQTLNVQQVTSSIVFSSGSNIFGNSLANTQQFTGSVLVTGSLTVAGIATTSDTLSITSNTSTSYALNLIGRSTSGNASTINFFNNAASSRYGFIYVDSSSYEIGTINGTNIPLIFATNQSERLRIDSNGTMILGGTSTTGTAGTGSGRGNLILAGSTSNKITFNNNSTTVNGYVYSDGSELQISSGAGFMNFYAGSSERMRITSGGNVGIGTASPQTRLHVANASSAVLVSESSGVASIIGASADGTTSQGLFLRGFPLTFTGNGGGGAEHMRITSSGNVGIGTSSPVARLDTISAETGTYGTSTQQVVARFYNLPSSLGSGNNSAFLSLQTSADGGNSNPVARIGVVGESYGSNNGAFVVATRDGGGVTERMRITSGGNVGIGTTSPSAKLHIDSPTSGASNEEMLRITRNTAGQGIRLMNYDGGSGIDGFTLKTLGSTNLLHFRMDGNVGIGTTTPSERLEVNGSLRLIDGNADGPQLKLASSGFSDWNIDNFSGNLRAYYGSTEYLRVTSGGNVGIGTNNPTKRLQVEASVAGEVTNIKNTRNNGNGDYALVTELGSNANNTNNYHYIAGTGGADRMYVYGNGNIVNTNGSYGTLSDISLKENIVDATPKLADLLQLKVRNFNLIGSEEKQIGFVAQEFEEIFPKMVDIDGKNGMKTIKTSVLVPMLVKAIQEQQTLIESLKSRIEILEQ